MCFMCRSRRSKVNAQRGVTLLELMIAVSILAIVTIAAMTFMTASTNALAANERMIQDERNIRQALLTITRELHTLEEDPPTATEVSDTRFTTTADPDIDELHLGNGIDYVVSNGELTREGSTLAEGITKFKASMVGQYVEITIKGRSGMEVTTKIKVLRGS